MTEEQLEQAINDYKSKDKMLEDEIYSYKKRIEEIETIIQSRRIYSIYSSIYKEEYGDYHKFVEDLAGRLRDEQRTDK